MKWDKKGIEETYYAITRKQTFEEKEEDQLISQWEQKELIRLDV